MLRTDYYCCMSSSNTPTYEQVIRLMYYENGKLFSCIDRGKLYFGYELGTLVKNRIKIQIGGKKYYRARVVWCLHNNSWPVDDLIVDHINRNSLDDRIENLRAISQTKNMRNKNAASKNTSGRAGVSITKDKKWRASIQVGNKHRNLGTYSDLDQAIAAREQAERELW